MLTEPNQISEEKIIERITTLATTLKILYEAAKAKNEYIKSQKLQ